jgi:hypothetical protein
MPVTMPTPDLKQVVRALLSEGAEGESAAALAVATTASKISATVASKIRASL